MQNTWWHVCWSNKTNFYFNCIIIESININSNVFRQRVDPDRSLAQQKSSQNNPRTADDGVVGSFQEASPPQRYRNPYKALGL